MINLNTHNQKSSKFFFRTVCILFLFIQALLGFVLHDFYERFEALENESNAFDKELSVLKTEFIDLEKNNAHMLNFIANYKKD